MGAFGAGGGGGGVTGAGLSPLEQDMTMMRDASKDVLIDAVGIIGTI